MQTYTWKGPVLTEPLAGHLLCWAALQSCVSYPPGARTYDHLKKTREEERLKRTMLSEVLQYIQDSSACQQWLRRQADMCAVSQGWGKHSFRHTWPSYIFVGIFVGTLDRRVVRIFINPSKNYRTGRLKKQNWSYAILCFFFVLVLKISEFIVGCGGT